MMRKIILIFIFILFLIPTISYADRVIIKEDAKVGIIDRGPYIANARFLGLYKEKINCIDIHDLRSRCFRLKKLRDFNLIIFPTGSLYGVEKDIVLKYQLEKYVRNGGVLFCFSQQHGYEFSILPAGEVKGMGWREDEGDHIYSVYIDEYHPVLSNLTEYIANIKVDGYFTSYPKDTVVLLRRTKNNYPAMILYPFGKGYVIATTAYTDRNFGCMNLSNQEKNVYRDIISWSLKKKREKISSINKGEIFETNMNIEGPLNNSYIDSVVISIIDPDRNIVNTMTFPISLVDGKATIPISYLTNENSPTGIWWISYILLHERGFKIKRETHRKRFIVEDLPKIYSPDNDIKLTVLTPETDDSTRQKFIIKIKNNHNYDLVKYQLIIGKSNPIIEYPGEYWHNLYQKTITIPVKKEITLTWTEENFDTTNTYWFGVYKSWQDNYLYSFPGSVKRVRRSFWSIDPAKLKGLNINVTSNTNKDVFDTGETVTLTVYIKNNNPNIKPELYTEVKYAEFEKRISYKLDKIQTLLFNFPATQGQPKVDINTYEKNTRSLINKNFKYIRVCNRDIIIYTDKDKYKPGEVVHLKIITRSPGRLQITAPGGFEIEEDLSAGVRKREFILPFDLLQGTYLINYKFKRYYGEFPFHIKGVKLKVVECVLDKPGYYSGETIHTRYTVQSNKNVDTILRGMIITPDKKHKDWFKKPISLVEGYNNIETYNLFKSTYSGVHNIAYSFSDTDDEDMVLVSGIETFVVGNGKILDFITDRNEYLSLEDTVFFNVMISATGKHNLQIKEGNEVLYNKEIIVNGEKFHKIPLKGFSFGEHTVLLSLIGVDTNATKKTSFKYGVGIPDLRTFGIGIRRIKEKSYKFSSTVRNTSSLSAENIKTRFILKKEDKTSLIINANNILLIEGGESTGVYAIAENLEYGEYTVIMEVDWDNNVFEKNEKNNSTSKQFKVEDKQPPSVIISSPISDKHYGGSMNITATVSDKFAGIEKVTYSIDRKSPKLMTQISGNTLSAVFSNTIDTYKMKDGFHDVKIIAKDNNGRRNLNPPQVFFHIDNEIPKVFIGFDSPVIAKNRKLYVKNNTSILLRTSILSSEITKYKINNGDWIIYKDPFTLGEQLDGDYTISFFTKNEVGNQSEINTQIVFLDTTPPETIISFEEFKGEHDGKIIINESTKILLKSSDEGCGVQLTKYRINKGVWITYKQPFNLIETNNKNINIEFYSVDKLENQEKIRSVNIKISEQ